MYAHFVSFGALRIVNVVVPRIVWYFSSREIGCGGYHAADVNIIVKSNVQALGDMHHLGQDLGLEGVENSRQVLGIQVRSELFSWHVVFAGRIADHSCTYNKRKLIKLQI